MPTIRYRGSPWRWYIQLAASVTAEPCCHGRPKERISLSDGPVTAAGDGSGRAGLINREVRHGSENSSVRLASWRWPRVRRNDCGSEFRFDPRGSPGQLSARPSVCSSGEQMRGVRRSGASPKMSTGPGVRRKHEPLRHGRAGGEMSARPGVRRKHEPLRHGRAGGEMSAGPGVRPKHEPLCHGRAGGEMSAGPGIRR